MQCVVKCYIYNRTIDRNLILQVQEAIDVTQPGVMINVTEDMNMMPL